MNTTDPIQIHATGEATGFIPRRATRASAQCPRRIRRE